MATNRENMRFNHFMKEISSVLKDKDNGKKNIRLPIYYQGTDTSKRIYISKELIDDKNLIYWLESKLMRKVKLIFEEEKKEQKKEQKEEKTPIAICIGDKLM